VNLQRGYLVAHCPAVTPAVLPPCCCPAATCYLLCCHLCFCKQAKQQAESTALKRLGTPQDMAGAVAFLASGMLLMRLGILGRSQVVLGMSKSCSIMIPTDQAPLECHFILGDCIGCLSPRIPLLSVHQPACVGTPALYCQFKVCMYLRALGVLPAEDAGYVTGETLVVAGGMPSKL
jgi:NAD(P)-dependent dehydrogenase (short-subunit alcohol dehydrogenase family)